LGSNRKDSWDLRFVQLADTVASWSKADTKVGAIIVRPSNLAVIAQGFNGFPRRIGDNRTTYADRWEYPTRSHYDEHAERNAIFNAAYLGHRTEGCTLYLNWAPNHICAECARAIIQAGITEVCGPIDEMVVRNEGSWRDGLRVAESMLGEAGVEVFYTVAPKHYDPRQTRLNLPEGF